MALPIIDPLETEFDMPNPREVKVVKLQMKMSKKKS
jgi:hypothetical protein